MGEWKRVKISQFLKEREGRYDPDDKAVLGLKRLNKIDFSGEIHLSDKGSKTDMIIVEPGDLVISGINVSKGALAVYHGEEPITATIHYSSYAFDERQIDIDYFKRFVRSLSFVQTLKDQVKGGIKTEIKPKHFLPLEIHLPDIKSQKEIVSFFKRIENEMGYLSGEITHQQSFLKQLRQQILQDAIEGKLTTKWRDKHPELIRGDNHASKLLEKIKAEKERLIKERNTSTKLSARIKKDKPLAPIADDEKPFDLPDGWVWCRLGEIATLITKGSSPNWQGIRYVDRDSGVRFITSKNVDFYKVDLTNESFVEKRFNQIEPRSILSYGDILTNIVGASIGRTAIYELNEIANINQAVCLIRLGTKLIDKTFLLHWMNSPVLVAKMHEDEFAPGRANLSMNNVANFLLPVASLAEQRAIVERVDKLTAMIDELEKQVSERKEQSEMLMQSVLREAFAKE